MSDRSVNPILLDMLVFIDRIAEYASDLAPSEFAEAHLVQDAVERNLEKISEASRRIPEELKAHAPSIP